jgi:prevent-host-death family protein
MEASVVDLRKKMSDVMSAIDRNERVTLTHRGHRKAVIVPFKDPEKAKVKVADLAAFGMWADRKDLGDVSAYVRKLRNSRNF